MASWVTGNTTLLAPEFGYKTGLWGMFSYALAGLGLILFAPLASRIKQLMPNGRTSGDFIRLRYGRLAWWVFMLITAIYTLGFLMTQAMGAGLLLQALSGFDYHVGMVVVIGVATVYTLFGGMRAVIGTDFIQSLLSWCCWRWWRCLPSVNSRCLRCMPPCWHGIPIGLICSCRRAC